MSVTGRSPLRLLIVALAVPVLVAVYLTTFVRWLASVPRLLLVAVLGAPVIGSVYLDEAYRRAPEGLRKGLQALPAPRVTPLKAVGVLGLAIALLATSAPVAPVTAAKPAEAVIDAARGYLGTPYRLGRTGPAKFDCSGLIYRVFSDAGELPRIGGKRLRAVGYLRWFSTRGLASKSDGERGDLVVWGGGKHIGIYLGKGKVISALLGTGVTVHGLHSINYKFTTFLKVSWKVGDGTGGEQTDSKTKPSKAKKNRGTDEQPSLEAPTETSDVDEAVEQQPQRGLAVGTMNLRRGSGPDERVVGWVSRGSKFTILDRGHSPSGALWYSIEMRNGKSGWVYSRWVRVVED